MHGKQLCFINYVVTVFSFPFQFHGEQAALCQLRYELAEQQIMDLLSLTLWPALLYFSSWSVHRCSISDSITYCCTDYKAGTHGWQQLQQSAVP